MSLSPKYVQQSNRDVPFAGNAMNREVRKRGSYEVARRHITEDMISDLIGEKQIHKKHITRGWSLEIDRKKPNHEYSEENCVWCCYWCNNAKTDEFTYKEFKKIGETIKTVWNDRLKN